MSEKRSNEDVYDYHGQKLIRIPENFYEYTEYDESIQNFPRKIYGVSVLVYNKTEFYTRVYDYSDLNETFQDYTVYCESAKKLDLPFLIQIQKEAPSTKPRNLAFAVKSLNDNKWYRARLCTPAVTIYHFMRTNLIDFTEKTQKVELIDIGKKEDALLSRCVILCARFARVIKMQFNTCKTIDGLNNIMVNQVELLRNMIVYGEANSKHNPVSFVVPRIWKRATIINQILYCEELIEFVKSSLSNQHIQLSQTSVSQRTADALNEENTATLKKYGVLVISDSPRQPANSSVFFEFKEYMTDPHNIFNSSHSVVFSPLEFYDETDFKVDVYDQADCVNKWKTFTHTCESAERLTNNLILSLVKDARLSTKIALAVKLPEDFKWYRASFTETSHEYLLANINASTKTINVNLIDLGIVRTVDVDAIVFLDYNFTIKLKQTMKCSGINGLNSSHMRNIALLRNLLVYGANSVIEDRQLPLQRWQNTVISDNNIITCTAMMDMVNTHIVDAPEMHNKTFLDQIQLQNSQHDQEVLGVVQKIHNVSFVISESSQEDDQSATTSKPDSQLAHSIQGTTGVTDKATTPKPGPQLAISSRSDQQNIQSAMTTPSFLTTPHSISQPMRSDHKEQASASEPDAQLARSSKDDHKLATTSKTAAHVGRSSNAEQQQQPQAPSEHAPSGTKMLMSRKLLLDTADNSAVQVDKSLKANTNQAATTQRKQLPLVTDCQYDVLKRAANESFVDDDYAKACELYTKCIATVSGNSEKSAQQRHVAYLNRSFCYLRMNEPQRAADDASLVLEHDPNNVKALFRRALANNMISLPEAALVDINRLLEIEPNNLTAADEKEKLISQMKASERELCAKPDSRNFGDQQLQQPPRTSDKSTPSVLIKPQSLYADASSTPNAEQALSSKDDNQAATNSKQKPPLYATIENADTNSTITYRKYKCRQCDFSADLKGNVTQHEVRKHSVKDKKCQIEDCNFMYSLVYDLTYHMKYYHAPYKCPIPACDSEFVDKIQLEGHMSSNIHTNKGLTIPALILAVPISFDQLLNYNHNADQSIEHENNIDNDEDNSDNGGPINDDPVTDIYIGDGNDANVCHYVLIVSLLEVKSKKVLDFVKIGQTECLLRRIRIHRKTFRSLLPRHKLIFFTLHRSVFTRKSYERDLLAHVRDSEFKNQFKNSDVRQWSVKHIANAWEFFEYSPELLETIDNFRNMHNNSITCQDIDLLTIQKFDRFEYCLQYFTGPVSMQSMSLADESFVKTMRGKAGHCSEGCLKQVVKKKLCFRHFDDPQPGKLVMVPKAEQMALEIENEFSSSDQNNTQIGQFPPEAYTEHGLIKPGTIHYRKSKYGTRMKMNLTSSNWLKDCHRCNIHSAMHLAWCSSCYTFLFNSSDEDIKIMKNALEKLAHGSRKIRDKN